jgi:hypothetical protein
MGWVENLNKDAVERGRFTPAGRMLARSVAVATRPADWLTRRLAAFQYNRKCPASDVRPDDGYAILPPSRLPGTAEIVDECRRLFARKQAELEAIPSATKGKKSFLRNVLDDEDLRANPALVDFALSDALLSIVTNYLGLVPILNRVDLIYSIARATPDAGHISSQLFHQDHEGLRQAKLFLNIFDVDEEHGPFTLIPASRTEKILQAIRRQREEAGVAHHGHYPDDEVAAHGGLAEQVRLIGPAGTAAIVDTSRCLHAGSRVHQGRFRLCLYIQYCTTQEKANTFDGERFRNDPVKWLAIKRHAAARRA